MEYKGIEASLESYKKIMEKIEPQLKVFSDLSKYVGKLFLGIRRNLEISEQLDAILFELGFPPIRVLDKNIKKEIVDKYDNNDKNYMINYIEDDILKNLDTEYFTSLFLKWKENKLLNKRIHIMEELINLHNNRFYYGSTILALSQIEGIIADGFYHLGKISGNDIKNYISSMQGKYTTDAAFKRFYDEVVLVGFEHGKEILSNLSRHAIMHGSDTKYGQYLNSIKAILLLDYLQDRFCLYYIENVKTVHNYGCHYLGKTNKKIIGTKNIHALVREGYKQCKVCMKNK